MKKKYLKTVEDVLALKDTDTKIYSEFCKDIELMFINGVLCKKNINTGCFDFNIEIFIDPCNNSLYILEESKEHQEATEKDIGKLCYFWAGFEDCRILSVLKDREKEPCTYRYESNEGNWWQNCRPLTKEEIQEFMEKVE